MWRTIVPGTGHPYDTTHDDIYAEEQLLHIDGNGKRNSYEATCLFSGTHYALGVGYMTENEVRYTTPELVVTETFVSIEWQYQWTNDEEEEPDEREWWTECTEDPWVANP